MSEFVAFVREQCDLVELRAGSARLVRSRKRRRALERRGHVLRWSPALSGWLWWPLNLIEEGF